MAQDAIILPDKRAALLNSFLANYTTSRDADQRNAILQQQANADVAQRNRTFLETMAKADPVTRQRIQQAVADHPEIFGNLQLPSFGNSDADTAYLASHKFQAGQAQAVAGGSNDVQANNSVNQLLYNQQLSEPAMRDVSARNLRDLSQPTVGGPNQPQGAPAPPPNTTTPSSDAYVNALRRDTGDLTTAGQNLQSQTQLTTNREQISAEAPVRAAKAAAAMAQARDANAKAVFQEAKNKMVMGDSSGASNIYAKGVLLNPQSYYGLSSEEKQLAAAGLGGRVPKKLTDYETRRLDAADNGMTILGDVKKAVDKWQQRGYPITGPAIGRFNAATNTWGDQILPTVPAQYRDEYLGDVASIQENLTANVMQEAQALIGGRPAYQVINMLYQTGPNISKGQAAMSGALQNMLHRYQVAHDQIDRKQWGGQPPTMQGGMNAPQTGTGQKDSLGILQ